MPTDMYPTRKTCSQRVEEFERLYLQPDEKVYKTFKNTYASLDFDE